MCEKMRRRRRRRRWWGVGKSKWEREEDRKIERERSQFQQEIIVSNSQTRIISCYSSITSCMAFFFFFLDGWRRSRKERGTWIKIWVIADSTFIRPKPNCHHSALLSLKRKKKKKEKKAGSWGEGNGLARRQREQLCCAGLLCLHQGPARWTDVTTPDSGGSGRCMQVCVFDKRTTQAPWFSIPMSSHSFGGMEEKKKRGSRYKCRAFSEKNSASSTGRKSWDPEMHKCRRRTEFCETDFLKNAHFQKRFWKKSLHFAVFSHSHRDCGNYWQQCRIYGRSDYISASIRNPIPLDIKFLIPFFVKVIVFHLHRLWGSSRTHCSIYILFYFFNLVPDLDFWHLTAFLTSE